MTIVEKTVWVVAGLTFVLMALTVLPIVPA
jgi:hypothetical protein